MRSSLIRIDPNPGWHQGGSETDGGKQSGLVGMFTCVQ